jgi:hypothetical protein
MDMGKLIWSRGRSGEEGRGEGAREREKGKGGL